MSRAQEPHRPFLPFGNPFRMILPKGSNLSPKLLSFLNTFDETLSNRINKLRPASNEDVLRLSWMRLAVESLCKIHTDVKTLITDLEFPISDWEDEWVDAYLDNSLKLLDICNAFTSEISRLKQGHLYLQHVAHNLSDRKSPLTARSSLDGWKKHVGSKNPRLDKCFAVIDGFAQKLDLPKIKNSAKGKILMRAMYGVKVVTLLICSIFAAAFSSSANKLLDMKISESFLWAEAFADLQAFVNTEIRSLYSSGRVKVVKEMEYVDNVVKNLHPIVGEGAGLVETEKLHELTSDFVKSVEIFSGQLDLLGKEVNRFFQIVLTGRDSLLSNLKAGSDVFNCGQGNNGNKV